MNPAVVHARWTGEFHRNPLFDASRSRADRRLDPRNDGIAPQLASVPLNEADMVIGLDFGTSTVKAVIRDATARQAYLVPFTTSVDQPYLLPSTVHLKDGVYSLDPGGTEIGNLKLDLLECPAALPVEEFVNACAFLALVIRHCRGWLLDQHERLYRDHRLTWRLNVGLPARSYEDDRVVKTFRRVAWAAACLAGDRSKPVIRAEDAGMFRQLALEAFRNDFGRSDLGAFEFMPDDVDVVPEIAAQVHGFVESSRSDVNARPYMALMDVGAGTVDTAFFCVLRDRNRRLRFVFYSSDVQQSGVVNLHRARIAWLRDAISAGKAGRTRVEEYLRDVYARGYTFSRIPESVSEYVPGLDCVCPPGTRSIDGEFFFCKVLHQLAGCIRQGKEDQRFRPATLGRMPFFVCGGGSRMRFYGRASDELNARWHGGVSLDPMVLPMPDRFEAPGLANAEYDRVSVACGLSWPKLGEIIRSQDIPPIASPSGRDYRDRFVDKDMV